MTCFSWPIYLDVSYPYTMPNLPQPNQGRTHPLAVSHGSIVYVTEQELHRAKLAFNNIFFLGIACAALVGLVLVYWKPSSQHRACP